MDDPPSRTPESHPQTTQSLEAFREDVQVFSAAWKKWLASEQKVIPKRVGLHGFYQQLFIHQSINLLVPKTFFSVFYIDSGRFFLSFSFRSIFRSCSVRYWREGEVFGFGTGDEMKSKPELRIRTRQCFLQASFKVKKHIVLMGVVQWVMKSQS